MIYEEIVTPFVSEEEVPAEEGGEGEEEAAGGDVEGE
jgi:hypothetical protein